MRIALSMPMRLANIIAVTEATAIDVLQNPIISHIVTNSKEARPGDLFFAFCGERFDGHDYVVELLKTGVYCITERPFSGTILVNDTVDALLKLASFYKSNLPCLIHTVAITGSVGKTTVKNFLFSLLGTCYRCHATRENENNQIGVSLTVLSAPINTEYLIVEMGTSQVGEIEKLSTAILPDMAVITCIGTAHIGHFGTRENIAKEKTDILKGLRKDGQVFIPANESLLQNIPGAATVSVGQTADYMLVTQEENDRQTVFFYYGKTNQFPGVFNVPGRTALVDLAFALAVAEYCRVPGPFLSDTVKKIESSESRFSKITVGGIDVIDDSYNASLESVLAGIYTCRLFDNKRKIVLFGDILELGSYAEEIHKNIGKAIAKNQIDEAFFFGVYAPYYQKGAVTEGFPKQKIHIFLDTQNPSALTRALIDFLKPGDLLYAKASHGVALSRILQPLQNQLKSKGT